MDQHNLLNQRVEVISGTFISYCGIIKEVLDTDKEVVLVELGRTERRFVWFNIDELKVL